LLLNSGNPSLRGSVRFLLNDPSTAANNMYSDQEIDDGINLSYFDVYNDIIAAEPSWFYETSFADTVVDQVFYAKATDMNQFLEIAIDYDGKNIDTDTTTSPTRLQRVSYRQLRAAADASATNVNYWAPFKEHIAVHPAVGIAGTSSLRAIFIVEPTALSDDTDEPIIPFPQHKLITIRASIYLLSARHLDDAALRIQEIRLTQQMFNTISPDRGDSPQFPSAAGQSVYVPVGKQGVGS